MKTIVVATDFSENAHNALQYAGALAAYTRSRIILFNAYRLPVHAANTLLPAASVAELLKANKKRLEDIAHEVSSQFGIFVSVHTKMDAVSESLDEIVFQENADLVVIGMHANDWGDRLFGNTTTSIIREATYPVLVVPANVSFHGIERILYAFDADCLGAGNKLQVVKDIAKSFKAEVQVFHVETNGKPAVSPHRELAEATVGSVFDDIEHQFKATDNDGVVEGIENEIREYAADLLVMVPHKLSFWKSLINLSNTRSVVLRTRIPLLVVPNTATEHYN